MYICSVEILKIEIRKHKENNEFCIGCDINPKAQKSSGYFYSYCYECIRKQSKERYRNKIKNNINKKVKLTRTKKDHYFNSHIRSRYGIDKEGYDNLLKIQNHSCAICKTTENSAKRKFSIDHNHETGEIRGLLYNKCNAALGLFNDNTTNILRAAKYLKERGNYGSKI